MQTYTPLRFSLLSKHDLRDLSKLEPQKVIIDIFINYLIIFLSIYYLSLFGENIINSIFSIICLGTSFYSLMIIAHDGLHRRLFNNIKKNDLFCDIFILGMFASACRVNRNNHMEHHKYSALKDDPDKYKYNNSNRSNKTIFFVFLTGLTNILKFVENVYLNKKIKKNIETPSSDKFKLNLREIITIVFWQIIIFTLLTNLFGFKGYFLYWLLPIYIFAWRGDLMRVFCEHNVKDVTDDDFDNYRLITYDKPNFLEKIIFSPNNMNFHAEHHLFPQVPYYNLEKLHNRIKDHELFSKNIKIRKSYFGYIFNILLENS